MIDVKLDDAKKLFLDVAKIIEATDRASVAMLSKFGAFVRKRAISSIRTRKRISAPGQPPSSHTGIYKRFIFFFVEQAVKNVVIGPIKLDRGTGSAPKMLEHGGEAAIVRRHRAKQETKAARYRARPHMQPAFDIEIKKAPELLRGQIKG